MNFWGVALLAFLALILCAYWLDKWAHDDGEPIGAAVFFGGAILIALGAVQGCNKTIVHGELLDVAQLRSAAAVVDLRASEDVMGKVVDFNQALAGTKWTNRQWWGDPFVPDEWDTVSFIPVETE